MPTPSIQTLRADAQQVLNLDSISAVRSVVAATLANANAGTPLNPNLTTQQLWNEFYQIVTQPKSDIESIIANQLMKFLFAPPAPGGAGADKQVIFNDGGVLAGDPQFLWNKTTNLLTVTGSATITGDLTVDTSTLKVDSANNRVGIRTASPAEPLTVDNSSGVTTGAIRIYAIDQSHSRLSIQNGNGQAYHLVAGNPGASNAGFALYDNTGAATRWYVDNTGVHTWQNVGGVAGTAMTLNATGLALGTSPAANTRLSVRTAATTDKAFGSDNGVNADFVIQYASGLTTIGSELNAPLAFKTNNVERMRIDTAGNVGIGVTGPSYRLQANVATGGDRNIFAAQVTGASSGFTVQWNNGTQKLRVNFSDLPTSSAGLPANTLWVDTAAGNTLKLA